VNSMNDVTVYSDERHMRVMIAIDPAAYERAVGRFAPKLWPVDGSFLPILFEALGPEEMLYAGYGAVMREAIGGSLP